MAPCMGPMSPVRAYSLWADLCPEKLVKLTKTYSAVIVFSAVIGYERFQKWTHKKGHKGSLTELFPFFFRQIF